MYGRDVRQSERAFGETVGSAIPLTAGQRNYAVVATKHDEVDCISRENGDASFQFSSPAIRSPSSVGAMQGSHQCAEVLSCP